MSTKAELEEQLSELEKINEELETIITNNKKELKKNQEDGIQLLSTIESLKDEIDEKNKELALKVSEFDNKQTLLEKENADLKENNDQLKKSNVDLFNRINNPRQELYKQPPINTTQSTNASYKYNLEDYVCYPSAYSNMPFKVLEHQGQGTEGPLYRIHNFENDMMLYNISEKNLKQLYI